VRQETPNEGNIVMFKINSFEATIGKSIPLKLLSVIFELCLVVNTLSIKSQMTNLSQITIQTYDNKKFIEIYNILI